MVVKQKLSACCSIGGIAFVFGGNIYVSWVTYSHIFL